MALTRLELIKGNFEKFIRNNPTQTQSYDSSSLAAKTILGLFRSQLLSRLIDYKSRELKKEDASYYTISSAGHESNVVFGALLRSTDPCLLHYRSGALMMERMKAEGEEELAYQTLLGICASAKDPSSGGRHKVWGSKKYWVPPQTSTIASHLPKAVGMAFSIGRAQKVPVELNTQSDAVVFCSFGDASVNHSTAQGAFNTARWINYQNLPLPLLFLCEDNGLGISVKSPKNWIAQNFKGDFSFKYFEAEGQNLPHVYQEAEQAIDFCRKHKQPVFFHLKVTRLMGHAGSDMESQYLSHTEMEENESRDPLLASAGFLLKNEIVDSEGLVNIYEDLNILVDRAADRAKKEKKLQKKMEVMESLNADPSCWDLQFSERSSTYLEKRSEFWKSEGLPESQARPRHLAMLINWALKDLMLEYPEMLLFGEDVAKKGGVYNVTKGLEAGFGPGRVFNTLLDEQSILGLAIGAAQMGYLPFPEIQYLAYYHNAEDQIRGEAASQGFFSKGQFHNPMVIRVASLAYQRGFGGHFHNDNSIGALRDVPGVVIACPSRGDDAVKMLRTCARLAKVESKVVFFLEPIALYMRKDLYQENDQKWSFPYPEPKDYFSSLNTRVYFPENKEITIFSYGNGVPMALRVLDKISKEEGTASSIRLVDLRWLAPLPEKEILHLAGESRAVLVLDECRKTGGGVWEAIFATLAENQFGKNKLFRKVVAEDSYIPLGPAANLVLPSEKELYREIKDLVAVL